MLIKMRHNDRPPTQADCDSIRIEMPDGTTWEIREAREDQLQLHCVDPTHARMSVVPVANNLIKIERRK